MIPWRDNIQDDDWGCAFLVDGREWVFHKGWFDNRPLEALDCLVGMLDDWQYIWAFTKESFKTGLAVGGRTNN